MLCPKCHREGKNRTMEIRGTQWHCPEHNFYVDFPQRQITLKEALKIIKDKEDTIEELERENEELKEHIRWLEEPNID